RVFIQKLEHQSGRLADWVRELLCRKSNFVVTCALANKGSPQNSEKIVR
ncbi:hypothetical protein ACMS75_003977, partial [Escherichia coli O9,9a:H21]